MEKKESSNIDIFDNVKGFSAKQILLSECFSTVCVGAILFILLNFYYLITDISRDFYSLPHAWPNLMAILMIIIPSAIVIILRMIPKARHNERILHASIFLYHFTLILAVAIFTYTNNIRALEAGANMEYGGIVLSSIYLIMLLLAPLPGIVDSILLTSLVLLSALPLMILPGHENFLVFPQMSYRLVIIIGYFYMRRKNIRAAEEKVHNQTLTQQLLINSYIDQLTNAFNRHALEKYIASLITVAPGEKYGIIMFDIDFFKSFNDKYTHSIGDTALYRVADTVMKTLGNKDKYLFRFGGEEFVVVLTDCGGDEIVQIAEKYRNAVLDAKIFRDDEVPFDCLTISLGCASLIFDSAGTISQYVQKADVQLYNAKRNGKNCISFDGEIFC